MRRFSQTANRLNRLSRATRTTAVLTAAVLGVSLTACGEEESFNAQECPEIIAPADASAEAKSAWTHEELSHIKQKECATQADADAFYAAQADGATGEGNTDADSSTSPNPTRGPDSPNSSDGDSGSSDDNISASSPEVEESPEIARERKVYRNSADFQFLDTDGLLTPGAKYIVDGAGGQGNCSFGWMVHPENDNSRLLNLTAGHCGEVGDKVYVRADGQNAVNVGEIVWQAYSGSDGQVDGGPDYALIEIYSEYFEYAFATPAVNMGSTQVELKGWAGKDWLEENQPYMCRLGFRSGLSCGNFQKMTNDISVTYDAISDHGDSGGVVWAFDPSDSSQTSIYAVGVTSWLQYEDATTAGAKTVESPMNAQDLGLYAF
ncbi:MAG TPA: S1 family peptidase [Candidatus Corynebacterium faecigallinarum]|uniref:S1 family peptidase n=1 Tax=Candidatus Corynebacterium faecigallinarum TaxID=2838528 RepID=A0A9D2QHL3_9CORY|nr:S1 family peptidase [Candidatus Corynebacterium faecigallinarum]